MVRHIVAWNYRDEFSDEENRLNCKKVKRELEGLTAFIPQISSLHVILNPADTSDRKVILMSLFESEDALAQYQIHPEHKRVSSFVGTVLKDRVCLDICE